MNELTLKAAALVAVLGTGWTHADELPQKAEACRADCDWGSCVGTVCTCVWKAPVCFGP